MAGHIAVIDPGTRVPELDTFNRMSLRSRVPLTYHIVAQHGLDSLRSVADDTVAVVVLGSGASVHDDLPWQHALKEWLGERLQGGMPALGLCYGHQLFADLFGGTVGFLFDDRHKLRGLRRVELSGGDIWPRAAGELVVSHREAVMEVPDAFDVVATSPQVAVEAMAHTRFPIYGVQAHPEATADFVQKNGIPVALRPGVFDFGHTLVDAFLDQVADLHGTATG